MDLVTLRAAAGGGSIDGHSAVRLVAAGFTLLQRSPVLVRALAGKRAAILLPTSPQFLVALAAADGRGAVLVDPLAAPAEVAVRLADAGVGAVLTTSSLAPRLPVGAVRVLLDQAPGTATVVAADGTETRVDLGSHFGLDVEGDADATGRDEECVVIRSSASTDRAPAVALTHRDLISRARRSMQDLGLSAADHVLAMLPFTHPLGLIHACLAPMLAGARVSTIQRPEPAAVAEQFASDGITAVAGASADFAMLVDAIEGRAGFAAPALRACLCAGTPPDAATAARWAAATGVALRVDDGLGERA